MLKTNSHHQLKKQELFLQKNKKAKAKINRKLIWYYFKKFKWSWIIIVLVAALATLANCLAIFGMSGLTTTLVEIFNSTSSNSPLTQFLITGGVLIVFYFLNAAFTFLLNFIVIGISQKIGANIRIDLFKKTQSLSVQYFDTHESGNLMSVLTNDVYNIVLFFSQNSGQIISGIFMMLGMLIVMFVASSYLALISLAILPILFFVIFVISKKSQPAFANQQKSLGQINGFVEEMISGQNIVTLFNQENLVKQNFIKLNNKLNDDSEKAQSISGITIPWNNFVSNFTILFITTLAVLFTNLQIPLAGIGGNFVGVGLVTSFMLALRNFNQPINSLMGMIASFQSSNAGINRVAEIFTVDGEDKSFEKINVENLKGNVEIKKLNFSYIPGRQILKNVSISAKAGETVAIIGPTGSGKSTIINLLTKFYDIDDGDITIDNYDIKEITKKSMRNQVSIVLQDTYFFSGTIQENLKYANPKATFEQIVSAAKTANCHSFIMQLNKGYDFVLSENAQELSQGQKQLLAIARALISTSNILILDEATSNIDTKTEIIVQDAMLKLIKNKTSFVIAHRLSTIKNADKIVVLVNGEVIETGNHKALIAKKGFYYKMYTSQFTDQEE